MVGQLLELIGYAQRHLHWQAAMQLRQEQHSRALGGLLLPDLFQPTGPNASANQPGVAVHSMHGSQPLLVDGHDLDKAGPGHITHTKQPMVTGTSVIAFKYKDGVMIACDTLG
jgi:20S proteasome subunit beta 7